MFKKPALVALVTGLLLDPVIAGSDTATAGEARTDQVRIHYRPPVDPAHQPIYDLLKQRQGLERLKEFLSPYRLEWELNLELTGCDGEADAMYSDDTITICYEYIAYLRKHMPEKTTPGGIDPADTLIGPFVDTVLHEFSHALFDYLDVPILGREEDAADQVAAYIYLQLDDAEALRLIQGTVYTYLAEARSSPPPTTADFAGEHSTPEQRAFNLMCLAYGANRELFADLIELGGLPAERAEICEEEYELIGLAYEALIGPYVDEQLAQQVFKQNWLRKKPLQLP